MSGLKKNVVYNTLLSISQILFPLVTFPYASRVLGPEALGAVSFADNFTIYFLIFAALGIPLYGVREIAKVKHDSKRLGQVYSELLFIHLLSSCAAVIILFFISYYTGKLRSNFALYQIGMGVLLGNVFIAEWFFQGIEKYRYIALRTVTIRLFTITLMFLLVHSIKDRNTYYALNLVAVTISALLNTSMITRLVRVSFKGMSLKKHVKPLFLILASGMVTTIYLVFDTVILGFLTNDVTVGYYAASMRISKISLAIIGTLSIVLLPRLTLAFQKNDHMEARALLGRSMNFVVFLSIPIAAGTWCLSEEIIRLFAGNNYLPAIGSLRVLCFIVIFVGMAQVFSNQILLPLHQEKKILYASLFGVVMSLTLNFTLIPVYKHLGAAISSLCTEMIVTLVLFIYARKLLKFPFPLVRCLQSALTCALFFVVKYLVVQVTTLPVLVLIFTIGISAVIYLLVQVLLWKNKEVIHILVAYPALRFLSKL